MKAYNTLSIAVYGTIIGLDTPRPQSFPFPQVPSVDDMLSGAAWKDVASSSIGGSGPYVPKMLLGRFDSEEERESRLRYQGNKRREERIRNAMTAVKMMRQDGLISDAVASELDSKVHDDFGMPFTLLADPSVYESSGAYSYCSHENVELTISNLIQSSLRVVNSSSVVETPVSAWDLITEACDILRMMKIYLLPFD
jgi:hypothetical protein